MVKKLNTSRFRVGVVGESLFDTRAMLELLQRQYGQRVQFVAMPVRLDGGQLDGKKARTMFKLTYEDKRPDLVVVFRDLDAPANDQTQLRKRQTFFEELNDLLEQKGILLLHVYTIEALLIAHVEVFQKSMPGNAGYRQTPPPLRNLLSFCAMPVGTASGPMRRPFAPS